MQRTHGRTARWIVASLVGLLLLGASAGAVPARADGCGSSVCPTTIVVAPSGL